MKLWEDVKSVDPEIYEVLVSELKRQQNGLELIASENFTSLAIIEAAGSMLTNKYAEGYPGHRYYGGCEVIDIAERLARSRAMELFGSEYANVQPHSGSQANMAVYMAVLEPGDTVMGLALPSGGHLTHGATVNFSGKIYNSVSYTVNPKTEVLDYDEIEALALKHKPKLLIAGGSAYPREIDFKRFREIADEVGAVFMVDMAHFAGLVAAKIHPNPVEYADIVTTTTHKTLRGPRGGMVLSTKKFKKAISKTVFPGMQGGPLMHIIAAKAVALKEAMTEEFVEYQKSVKSNASKLAKALSEKGLRIVSGGTDTHLMLVDVTGLGINGKIAETVLGEVNITVNKNTIPNETLPPTLASGVRIGTPAVTTRGMKEEEMEEIADIIVSVLKNHEDEAVKKQARDRVADLCKRFPLYPEVEF